ncbi:MAG: metallophosphoesterase [Bacteroidetes bacterium]|nr:metallophosphoesterase [Bacteroidota bacterium]
MSIRILIFAAILFLLDLYVFQGVKILIQHRSVSFQRIAFWVYWLISAFSIGTIFMGQWIDWHTWNKAYRTYSFALIFVFSFTKVIIGVFMLLDDIIRLFRLIWVFISTKFFASNAVPVNEPFRITRLNFIIKAGFGIAAIPFFTLIKVMISDKYNYKVRPVNLALKNLPSAFDGLKIVQISDLHTGSFMGTEHLEEAARLIMEQKPDLIFFTGDLVNDLHTEALPFKEIFQSLKAPHGVYSILGNHDYGDYYRFPDEHSKHQNLEQLKAFHGEVGWKLLLNEHAYIEKGGQKIGLIGVENFSGKRNFSRYGSMEVATKNFEAQPVNILLSHDPSHWDYEIRDKYKYVDLTLSGHTHGFQFGIEIPGLKWSPVQYMYKQWADLYKEENQYLYVNRGLGFLGYPGRVGILPEITVFTLAKT